MPCNMCSWVWPWYCFTRLLLSFSEHIGFNPAYLVAALHDGSHGVLLCASSVLGSTKLAAYVAATLTLLYSFIFILIQLKDFALCSLEAWACL